MEESISNREEIKEKLRKYFDGKIVRKDLTKKIKEGALKEGTLFHSKNRDLTGKIPVWMRGEERNED